ncbi:isochorismatase family protein [Anaerosphaera multitolerans]|uniref:nicotinamidase n=1 Tax=Anaerosphaera multitolerans TaxID=2487351 RepID=A0A437S9A9_9FIRM|nr:isochorismatase family protein [Anaerosphaera multitolerans]RVU55703.1 isochorismatase family protein [Anaerosphaera multitolerans]
MKTLVVVDCQKDFIDGSLACIKSKEAVNNIVKKINSGAFDKVVYSMDYHSPENKSFEINGGIWPVHCVAGEEGSLLSEEFSKIENENHRPNEDNIYKKGLDDEVEEYSAYYAKNYKGESIDEIISDEFIVCGLASEYCVRETILELEKNGKNVSFYVEGTGYVNEKDHLDNLKELKNRGIEFI